MKVIDGKNAILGRLASYVAKETIKGEEITIVNCDSVIITGNKKDIEKKYFERRQKVGSGQKGPKISRSSEKIVKRAIRGMLPNHRGSRGKELLGKIKCYNKVPKDLEAVKKITSRKDKKNKFIEVKDIYKK